MESDIEQAALKYHRYPHPGKIEVVPTKPYNTPEDLSLAYSPGVAYPCLKIKDNADKIFDYTNRGNLVAVISNGTAVLGLGNIGAKASKPVMEGKALLFKIFAGLDAFDIEIDENDPQEFIKTVARLAPTFGGINLEDIKAPECFEIERELRTKLDIPVMHDDQHGTAIISSAALLNALKIQNKDITNIRVVVNGAGAAAIACTKLFCELGVRHKNIIMCDSKGVIRKDRDNLNSTKAEFATDKDIHTLADAMKGADVFLGLSVADVVTADMVKSMAERPIVFALANPSPEIAYDLAISTRPDMVFATGRSDYPNQINNVLGFPYIFRGALDCGATEINELMKVAAAQAVAELAQEPVPESIKNAYGAENLTFGRDYILPKPFDRRLLMVVAPAVIKAAEESGVARRKIDDMDTYRNQLEEIICTNDALISYLIKTQTTCRIK
ncbi:MAG: malate dehydrogenase [Bacteroides sp.]|nr:malate dehydrogenase [Bacteroides sp.]